jgi:hypothetical protein
MGPNENSVFDLDTLENGHMVLDLDPVSQTDIQIDENALSNNALGAYLSSLAYLDSMPDTGSVADPGALFNHGRRMNHCSSI